MFIALAFIIGVIVALANVRSFVDVSLWHYVTAIANCYTRAVSVNGR